MSKDPWPGDPLRSQSLNGFSYVEGNPVTYVDPSGLLGCEGGGNLAVMQFDHCLTGGRGGGKNPGPGVLLVPAAVAVTYAAAQLGAWVGQGLPPFNLLPPGIYSQPTTPPIQPCPPNPSYWPLGGANFPLWEPLTFPPYVPPYSGPTVPPFSTNPIPIPNVLTASTHKHHIFPQAFRGWFAEKGIDVDDYTVAIDSDTHLRGVHGRGLGDLPGRWNIRWAQFIFRNPEANAAQIGEFASQLMQEFGLDNLPIEPYE